METIKEEKNNIEIDVVKSDLKKVLAAHKKFAHQGKDQEQNILGGIKFTVLSEALNIETTDGCRALESELKLLANYDDKKGDFVLSAALASKLSFPKGDLNIVRIIAHDKEVEFIDYDYNTTQKLLIKEAKGYPKIKDVFPENRNFQTSISKRFIKDLSSLKGNILTLQGNAENKLEPILVKSESEGVISTALLSPIKLEEKENGE